MGVVQVVDGYIRVSEVGGRSGDSFQSPDTQEAAIRRWVEANGFQLGELLVELDVSGSVKAEDRGLEDLIRRAEQGLSSGIVCQYQDRLTRGRLADAASIWERLDKAGARFVAVDDGVDSRNEGSELFFAIRAALAREQWKAYAKKWELAKTTAKTNGKYIAKTPNGYERFEGKLVPGVHAQLIQTIFTQKLEGCSYAELAEYATEQGLPITVGGIRKLLCNPVYIGESPSGESPPIVDAETYARVQSMTYRRTATGAGAKTLCQGIAKCANCGSSLIVLPNRDKWSYYCRGQKVGGCNQRGNIATHLLDAYVQDTLLSAFKGEGPLARAYADQVAVVETLKLRNEKRFELEQLKGSTALISTVGLTAFEAMVKDAVTKLEMADAAYADALGATDSLGGVAKMLQEWDSLGLGTQRRLVASAIEVIHVGMGRKPVERKAQIIFKGGVVIGSPDDARPSLALIDDLDPLALDR